MLYNLFLLLRSFLVIYLALYLGTILAAVLPLAMPASICGMLVLLLALILRVVKISWVEFGSSLIIRYMSILFVPLSVGIIEYKDELLGSLGPLVIGNILSTFFTLILVAFIADKIFKPHSTHSHRREAKQNQLNNMSND